MFRITGLELRQARIASARLNRCLVYPQPCPGRSCISTNDGKEIEQSPKLGSVRRDRSPKNQGARFQGLGYDALCTWLRHGHAQANHHDVSEISLGLGAFGLPKLLHQYLLLGTWHTRERWREANKCWMKNLDRAAKYGVTPEDIHRWAWILRAETVDESIARLSRDKRPVPGFVIRLLLDGENAPRQRQSRIRLAEYVSMRLYTPKGLPRLLGTLVWKDLEQQHRETSAEFCHILDRLVSYCRNAWPDVLEDLANTVLVYINKISRSELKATVAARLQTEVANRFIQKFAEAPFERPLVTSEYNWKAQRILLAARTKEGKQLVLERASYAAIRNVLLRLSKSTSERQVASRLSKAWPPAPRALDGLQEQQTEAELWSRVLQAGAMMQESGYGKDAHDRILDALGGLNSDGSPTIQTRAVAPPASRLDAGHGLWAARIRATRNAHEAWAIFREPPKAGMKPNDVVYAEMFARLLARPVPPQTAFLPGEVRENFPADISNLSSYERQRREPPPVEDLHSRMVEQGIRAGDYCLSVLLASARTSAEAICYIRHSNLSPDAVRQLIGAIVGSTSESSDDSVSEIPMTVFDALIRHLCARQPFGRDDSRTYTEATLKWIWRAAELTKRRLPETTVEARTLKRPWLTVLREISRPNIIVSDSPPIEDAALAAGLFKDVFYAAEERFGVDADMFLCLNRITKKLAHIQMMQSDAKDPPVEMLQYLGVGCQSLVQYEYWRLVNCTALKASAHLVSENVAERPPMDFCALRPPLNFTYMQTLVCLGAVDEVALLVELLARRPEFDQNEVFQGLCLLTAFAERGSPEVRDRMERLYKWAEERDVRWPSPEDVEACIDGDRRGHLRALLQVPDAGRSGLEESNTTGPGGRSSEVQREGRTNIASRSSTKSAVSAVAAGVGSPGTLASACDGREGEASKLMDEAVRSSVLRSGSTWHTSAPVNGVIGNVQYEC